MTTPTGRHLDDGIDLLAVAGDDGWAFEHAGTGVAGRGVHAQVAAADAVTMLRDLGPDVFAIGARPFLPDAPWNLVVPAYQVRVDEEGAVRETTLPADRAVAPARIGQAPTRVDAVAVDDPDDWKASVASATAHIRAGDAEKIVLAREVRAEADAPFSATAIAGALRDRFAGCFVYSVDGLVGASPELLVERRGEIVSAQPMAGTAQRSADPEVDARLRRALFDSAIYRHEHQVTIDAVYDTLLSYASYLDFEPEPSIVTLPNVAHLATRVEGRLSYPPASVLELVEALHPTPAVSGRPRDAALELIAELEGRDRGRYAGAVGWVDAQGNGTWAVAIRCAQIDPTNPRHARIHAGCGLVADSDPATELAESEAKLRAMWSVLGD